MIRRLAMETAEEVIARCRSDKSHHLKASWWGPRFDNPWSSWKEKGLMDVARVIKDTWNHPAPASILARPGVKASHQEISKIFPNVAPDLAAIRNPPSDAVLMTWIGHATVLGQLGGLTFLTDPQFSVMSSPVPFGTAMRRYGPPACTADSEELAGLDFVMISHNHYDHLDLASVKALHARFGDAIEWFVPLGLAAWLRARGVTRVRELDWWDSVTAHSSRSEAQAEVVMLPAQHWSSRTGLDRRRSLWGSFAVIGKAQRFWFAGDTGYCPAFVDIGKAYGPFDAAAIPCGAYSPQSFLSAQHANPEEAVQIHKDVQSRCSLAIHHATFPMGTLEPADEPAWRIGKALRRDGLPETEFMPVQHGSSIKSSVAAGGTLAHGSIMPAFYLPEVQRPGTSPSSDPAPDAQLA